MLRHGLVRILNWDQKRAVIANWEWSQLVEAVEHIRLSGDTSGIKEQWDVGLSLTTDQWQV